jgi:hypothetical protein
VPLARGGARVVRKCAQPLKQGRSLKPPHAVFTLLIEQLAPRAAVGATCNETSVQIRRKERESARTIFDRVDFVSYILDGRTIFRSHQNGAGIGLMRTRP